MPCRFFNEMINDDIMRAVCDTPFFVNDEDPRAVAAGGAAPRERDPFMAMHWSELDTPVMSQVLDFQFPEEGSPYRAGAPPSVLDIPFPQLIKFTALAMMGRWVLPLGKYDTFQRFIAFLGAGGTGKTILLERIMKQWFPSEFVATLSSKMEEMFGLQGMEDKWVMVADEMRGRVGIDSSDLLCMVGGSTVKVRTKLKGATDVTRWKAQIAMGGNIWPTNLVDIANSTKRRTVAVSMNRPVPLPQKADGMEDRAAGEIGFCLLKCCAAYRSLLQHMRMHGEAGRPISFNRFLDPWFVDQADQWIDSVNLFDHFLSTGPFVFDLDAVMPRLYMPAEAVELMFQAWSAGRGNVRHDQSAFRSAFAARNIAYTERQGRMAQEEFAWPVGSTNIMRKIYVLGIDIHPDTKPDDLPPRVKEWFQVAKPQVSVRKYYDGAEALQFSRKMGDPTWKPTTIGDSQQRSRAAARQRRPAAAADPAAGAAAAPAGAGPGPAPATPHRSPLRRAQPAGAEDEASEAGSAATFEVRASDDLQASVRRWRDLNLVECITGDERANKWKLRAETTMREGATAEDAAHLRRAAQARFSRFKKLMEKTFAADPKLAQAMAIIKAQAAEAVTALSVKYGLATRYSSS